MGILFEVHNKLGTKYQEKHYQRAVEIKLKELNVPYQKEAKVKLEFGKEELGDLIWSIALLVQVAKEEKLFDMKDVLVHAKNKLIRRHPHVFGNLKAKDSEEALKIWKKIKREEKSKRLG